MLPLVILIAILNFALGYAFAVYMGWAQWPIFKRSSAAAAHTPTPAHGGHGKHH